MKIIDTVRRAGRSLMSAKARTILTAMAIAVGGFTLTLTLAAGNGVRDYTSKLVSSNFDPTELLVGRDPEVSNQGAPSDQPKEYDATVGNIQTGGPGSSLQVKQVTQADVEKIEALPFVEEVRENYQISIRYITREGQKKYTGSATVFNQAQKPEIEAGSVPPKGDIAAGTIVLPEVYIGPLGFKDASDAIGKEVRISVQQPFSAESLQALLSNVQSGDVSLASLASSAQPKEEIFKYSVGAVSKKSATSLAFGVPPINISEADAKQLYDFTSQGTSDYQKYLYVNVKVKDGTDPAKLQAAQKELEGMGFYVQSSNDIQKTITQFVDILQLMVGVFALITVIASVFGIVNTQYISVLERTREIGLMKALGMSRRSVSTLFTIEATWIGFLGGLIGSIIGFVVGVAVNPLITKQLDLGEGNSLIIFSPLQMVLLILALMFVATLAGLLPARKAAKLDPIEALRTE